MKCKHCEGTSLDLNNLFSNIIDILIYKDPEYTFDYLDKMNIEYDEDTPAIEIAEILIDDFVENNNVPFDLDINSMKKCGKCND